MKKIRYRVTNDFGDSKIDDIVDAYLISHIDVTQGLVYHPRSKGCCASIEICTLITGSSKDTDEWQAAHRGDGYVNIEKQKHLDKIIENLKSISYKELMNDEDGRSKKP